MSASPTPTDLEAMCTMTFATVGMLIYRLRAKEVVNAEDVNLIFDSVLMPYESPRFANDPVALRIRKLADEMASVILEVPKPPKKPQGK